MDPSNGTFAKSGSARHALILNTPDLFVVLQDVLLTRASNGPKPVFPKPAIRRTSWLWRCFASCGKARLPTFMMGSHARHKIFTSPKEVPGSRAEIQSSRTYSLDFIGRTKCPVQKHRMLLIQSCSKRYYQHLFSSLIIFSRRRHSETVISDLEKPTRRHSKQG